MRAPGQRRDREKSSERLVRGGDRLLQLLTDEDRPTLRQRDLRSLRRQHQRRRDRARSTPDAEPRTCRSDRRRRDTTAIVASLMPLARISRTSRARSSAVTASSRRASNRGRRCSFDDASDTWPASSPEDRAQAPRASGRPPRRDRSVGFGADALAASTPGGQVIAYLPRRQDPAVDGTPALPADLILEPDLQDAGRPTIDPALDPDATRSRRRLSHYVHHDRRQWARARSSARRPGRSVESRACNRRPPARSGSPARPQAGGDCPDGSRGTRQRVAYRATHRCRLAEAPTSARRHDPRLGRRAVRAAHRGLPALGRRGSGRRRCESRVRSCDQRVPRPHGRRLASS